MEKQDPYCLKWIALLGVCLLAFTAFLDATIVNTALPFIQIALKADILQLQWVANIFTLILSMTMIAVGKISDLLGRKRVFYVGVVIFAIGALGAGFSNAISVLVCFRALQAIGASIVFVVSAALLSDVFPENEREKAIGIYGGITGLGLMIGPFLGGILVEFLGWRWVFWINLPLIAVGLVACLLGLKRQIYAKISVAMDGKSLLLLMVGLASLMYGITKGAELSWSSYVPWVCLIAGVLALAWLVIMDESKKNALLDLPIFKDKLIALSALSCALAGVASTVFMFFDPLYLRILKHLSAFEIGLLIAVIPTAQLLISFVFSRLICRFGIANLLFFSIAAAFTAILLHRFILEETSLFFLGFPFFLLGVNWGLSNSTMIAAVNRVIASHKVGAAIGTIATIWNVTGSILLAFSAAVFKAEEAQSSFLPAFHRMVDWNILFSALLFLFALWIQRRRQLKS
jgi:EmrB/QacA subfamily drug resistance transporter